MGNSVIITAGGIGKRMGGNLPKQFLLLANKPLLFHTIQRFYNFDSSLQLIVSLPQDWIFHWGKMCEQFDFQISHEIVAGGKERFHSIQNALEICTGELIAVHDGVRPFPSNGTIENCFAMAEKTGAAVPVIEVKESLRKINVENSQALIRSEYRLVQTPQIFSAEILRAAYAQHFHDGITDDASLVEENGISISLVEGNETNIKITSPTDLRFAEMILKSEI